MPTQTTLLNQQNYLILKQVISKDVCELLSDYAMFKASVQPNINKSDALAGAHREYGDLLMESLLNKFTPMVEQATNLRLWPTLSFYYTYKNGDKLAPHKDRSSCQIVAGLCIGADDEFKQHAEGWPLIIKNQDASIPIPLDYGDMVIFKGHETEHWREAFTGSWFVSAIFGYVEQQGPFAYQKYDQRKALGKPHIGMLRWSFGFLKHKIKTYVSSLFGNDGTC